jgi:hypothetical protein
MYFDPSIQCRYYCRPTWKKLAKQYWRYGRYKVLVFKKAGRIGGLRQLIPAFWVAFLALSAAVTPFSAVSTFLSISILALYLTLGLLTAATTRKEIGWRAVTFLPVAATVHLVYGAGLWCGFFQDVVLGGAVASAGTEAGREPARKQEA